MAYHQIPQRFEDPWFFVADSDSDVSTIESECPDAPIGSTVIADNSGSPKVYMKFPAGSFSAISGS